MNQIIKKNDKLYPPLLKKIPDAPAILFSKGNYQKDILEETLAVVGSRRMTSYGKRVTEEIVGAVAEQGISIVSGFMYGIDIIAHQTALRARGKTIAVMPCGINVIHPSYQKETYNEIAAKGLILSEYDGDYPPDKWTYPRRNRIVVGLARIVLIIEAGEKSGSLITASLALKYKRKLLTVPGSIFSPVSKGTNELIKKKLAEPILSAKDVLAFFSKKDNKCSGEKRKGLTREEQDILNILKNEALEADKIATQLGKSMAEVNSTLSLLEIKGLVKPGGLKYFLIQN